VITCLDPAGMTPAARVREVASLLAEGYLRARARAGSSNLALGGRSSPPANCASCAVRPPQEAP